MFGAGQARPGGNSSARHSFGLNARAKPDALGAEWARRCWPTAGTGDLETAINSSHALGTTQTPCGFGIAGIVKRAIGSLPMLGKQKEPKRKSIALSLMRDVQGSATEKLRMFEKVRAAGGFAREDPADLAEAERMLRDFVTMEKENAGRR